MYEPRSNRRAYRRQRQGVAIVFLLFGLVTLMAALALVWDLAMLAYTSRQLQCGAQSAALAGAAQLMDRGLLCPQLESFELPPDGSGAGVAVIDRQIARARSLAMRFAAANLAGGSPIELEPNVSNEAGGDLVVGWLDDPTALGTPVRRFNGTGPVNTLVVRTSASGAPVSLRLARLFGLPTVDLTVTCQASVDQRVYGFQPAGHVTVPVVPLIITPEGVAGWQQQNCAVAVTGANDQYGIDLRTESPIASSDGIPEIVVRIAAPASGVSSGETNAHFLALHAPFTLAGLESQIALGLAPADLTRLGGRLALDQGLLRCAAPDAPDVSTLEAVSRILGRIGGAKRIWPLGRIVTDPQGNSFSEITGFASGRVVDSYTEIEGVLYVRIQPCLVLTSTALVRSDQPRNPWIGKLVLTR